MTPTGIPERLAQGSVPLTHKYAIARLHDAVHKCMFVLYSKLVDAAHAATGWRDDYCTDA